MAAPAPHQAMTIRPKPARRGRRPGAASRLLGALDVFGMRRLILLLLIALLLTGGFAWWYFRAAEPAVRLLPPPVVQFTCTAARLGPAASVECLEGVNIVLSGVGERADRARLELLVIGDVLDCRRLERHASGATLARCATSSGIDIACAVDPMNAALIDPVEMARTCPSPDRSGASPAPLP